MQADVIVIGAGTVGAAIAYGLARVADRMLGAIEAHRPLWAALVTKGFRS
jgi:glycine/D-amino acid oxidase-like deaminating enzyme